MGGWEVGGGRWGEVGGGGARCEVGGGGRWWEVGRGRWDARCGRCGRREVVGGVGGGARTVRRLEVGGGRGRQCGPGGGWEVGGTEPDRTDRHIIEGNRRQC